MTQQEVMVIPRCQRDDWRHRPPWSRLIHPLIYQHHQLTKHPVHIMVCAGRWDWVHNVRHGLVDLQIWVHDDAVAHVVHDVMLEQFEGLCTFGPTEDVYRWLQSMRHECQGRYR